MTHSTRERNGDKGEPPAGPSERNRHVATAHARAHGRRPVRDGHPRPRRLRLERRSGRRDGRHRQGRAPRGDGDAPDHAGRPEPRPGRHLPSRSTSTCSARPSARSTRTRRTTRRTSCPDLAAGPPQISSDGKTLTVKIRSGVRFSPPVNREVTSRDVEYAIERGFNPNVANPYASTYYGDLVGADRASGGPIPGIETPDDHTIVFKLTRPTASLRRAGDRAAAVGAGPAGVREGDSTRMRRPTTATTSSRPARTCSLADRSGKSARQRLRARAQHRCSCATRTGARRPTTVRRTSTESSSRIGGSATVSGRQVLAGSRLVARRPADAGARSSAPTSTPRDQIFFSPGAGTRYVALNTAIPPFDDANLRKAVAAALDREQMRQVRGGDGDRRHRHALPLPGRARLRGGRRPSRAPASTSSPTRRATERVAAKYMKSGRLPEREVHRRRRRSRSSASPARPTATTRRSSTRRCRTSASRRS